MRSSSRQQDIQLCLDSGSRRCRVRNDACCEICAVPRPSFRARSDPESRGLRRQALKALAAAATAAGAAWLPHATSDPKITPFREGPRLTQYSAYPGSIGPASAAVGADLIIPQLFAEAASGRSSIKDAMARAQQRATRYYK